MQNNHISACTALQNYQAPLQDALQQLQLDLTIEQQQLLLLHSALVLQWNRHVNLTSITHPAEVFTRHILDCMAIIPYLHGKHILDIGTGAGYPGILLAICCPDKTVHVLDSVAKKCVFLRHAVQQLGLLNVTVVAKRLQNFSAPLEFDNIVTRAWSSLSELVDLASPLIHAKGQLIAMKGTYPHAELAAITCPYQVHALQVPGLLAKRHLVCLQPYASHTTPPERPTEG